MVPDMEEGSGGKRNGADSAGTGTDQSEIAKQNMKNVASETAVRKRMMGYTSKLMGSDWVRREKHDACQRGQEFRQSKEQEKEGDRNYKGRNGNWYRYADCARRDSLGSESRCFFADAL